MLTYKILGPLEVDRDGESLPLGPAKQRALLARLLLSPNETISKDRLIDDLWGQSPPARAEQNLFQHVFRLRKVLGDGGRAVILTRDPGYLIQLGDEDELDAQRFEDLHARSHGELEQDPAQALATLDEALGLWRGPALVEFAYENFAQPEATRLDELRLAAEEGRMEALLALSRHKEAIPRLRTLVLSHPTREHLNALLALALYRAGRQTESLTVIQEAKKALAAEYGIDPGPELRQLEEAILRQDPELDPPAAPAPPAVEAVPAVIRPDKPEPAGRRRHARRGRAGRVLGVAAITAVVAVVAVAVAVAVLPADQPEPTPGDGTDNHATAPPVTGLKLEWDEAPATDFVAADEQRMMGAIELPSGFMGYGFSAAPGETDPDTLDYDTALWSGSTRQRWGAFAGSPFIATGNQRATKGWLFKDGSVVLVGWDGVVGSFDAAAWRLPPDADVWEQVSAPDALGDPGEQQIRDATVVDGILVAVGYTDAGGDRDAALWNADKSGRRWTYLQGAFPPDTGDQEMATVVRSNEQDLTVAAGYSEVDGDKDAAVWIIKGLHGRRIPAGSLGADGSQQVNEIVYFDGAFVAVGEETIGDDTDAVVWRSVNGLDWERVGSEDVLGGSGDQRMYAVASSELGLVAAGAEDTLQGRDAAVWTSLDGIDWERLPGHDPSMTTLTDSGTQEIRALLPIPGGFLALGAEATTDEDADLDARVWIGQETP